MKEKENNAKFKKMPEIRIMNTENNIKKLINEESRKNETTSTRGKFSYKGLSRDTILSNIEFQGFYLTYMKNKPKSRKQSTITLYDDKLYLYGGLSFCGMDDLWTYDLSGFFIFI